MSASFQIVKWVEQPNLIDYNPTHLNDLIQKQAEAVVLECNSVTEDLVVKLVKDAFCVTEDDLKRKKDEGWRKNELIFPRFTVCYLLRRHTKLSSSKIGLAVRRDHASALYAIKTLPSVMKVNSYVRNKVYDLDRRLCELSGKKPLGLNAEIALRERVTQIKVSEPRPEVVNRSMDYAPKCHGGSQFSKYFN